ncbi:hypothetical protein ACFOHS_19610 [Jhaorihella thermophila]
MGFRFIHSSDLHLGKGFGTLPEDLRGRLIEARHEVLARLAQAARDHGAAHVPAGRGHVRHHRPVGSGAPAGRHRDGRRRRHPLVDHPRQP